MYSQAKPTHANPWEKELGEVALEVLHSNGECQRI